MPRPAYAAVVLAGIDTLIVNAYGTLHPYIKELMEFLQAEAIEERNTHHRKDETRIETCFTLDEETLFIAPHGTGQGQYQYLFTCPSASFEVGEGRLNGIAVKVRLSSPFLWKRGKVRAWALVEMMLSEWGDFTYQPSEVHLCADVAGRSASTLRRRDFVTRSRVTRWHAEDAEVIHLVEHRAPDRPMVEAVVRCAQQETLSFSLGAPMSAALYDKPREIRQHSPDKLWFADLWERGGWNGQHPITRVEMRLKREILHELGIETMEDLFAQLPEIWAYATQAWMRHTIPTKDNHRERWPTSTWWQEVQKANFGRDEAEPAMREKQRAFHEKRILSSILGYVESYAAWMLDDLGEGNTSHLDGTMSYLIQRAQRHYEERGSGFQEQVRLKRQKFGRALTKEEAAFYEQSTSLS